MSIASEGADRRQLELEGARELGGWPRRASTAKEAGWQRCFSAAGKAAQRKQLLAFPKKRKRAAAHSKRRGRRGAVDYIGKTSATKARPPSRGADSGAKLLVTGNRLPYDF